MKYSIWRNETTETCYIAVPGSDSLRPELICTPYGRYIPLDEAEAEVIVTMLNNQIDQIESLKAENEKLKEGCRAVFDEAAKMKFLTCYPGDLFYVSRKAMETMSEALGYRIKEGKPSV